MWLVCITVRFVSHTTNNMNNYESSETYNLYHYLVTISWED
jgi:hypothetical protein